MIVDGFVLVLIRPPKGPRMLKKPICLKLIKIGKTNSLLKTYVRHTHSAYMKTGARNQLSSSIRAPSRMTTQSARI